MRGLRAAVFLVALDVGAGTAQGGQEKEQERDPQRGAVHLRQVRGCGTAAPCLVARPPGRT